MSFKLGDFIIDKILMGVAEDFDGNLLYVLTQLQEGKIDITADSKEKNDKDGNLIKKFWQAKKGTFDAQNAMLNIDILEATSGSKREVATAAAKVPMPKIIKVKAGSTVTLKGAVEGTVKVNAIGANGVMGKAYTKGTAASATEFGLTEAGVLTPPTDEAETMYIVKYQRDVESGIAIKNKADKFPKTTRLTLKALGVDPCKPDTFRACYIVLPSFQVSPEVTIDLQTDSTFEYKGDLQIDYCSDDKVLYEVYWAEEDEEEDE